ncbi:putative vacuolar protein sorting-associated protein [Rosa chinensis]|uniref:Putative vacuolar protein sorting-associated protein n=1 Tax=Rosa chinensis TaxID=74649 RepID=A0A2P6QUN1_ROSCH|nr:putative vacuolar protein sorting-associated protein [Rosa chinensis]
MYVLLHEEDDTFTDALPDFMSVSDAGFGSPTSDTVSCLTTEDSNDAAGFASAKGLVLEKNLVTARCISAEEFYEAEGSDYSNFVFLTFSTLSSSSPDYDGIDTQLSIRMSKLEFFCNRPTLVALIDFGLDLSSVYSEENTADITEGSGDKSLTNKEKTEEIGRVKGLLGYGKGRVVFYLNMNAYVDSVTVFLNKEDASLLATFVQESFVLDLKVRKFCNRSMNLLEIP